MKCSMEDISLTIWTDGEHLPETTAKLCLPIICLSAVVALHSILNLHVFLSVILQMCYT